MIDVVVFDMDGVIIDSEPVWQQVRVDLIGDRGGVWTDRDGDDTRGRSSRVWSARIAERLGGAMTPAEVFNEVLKRMGTSCKTRLPLFPELSTPSSASPITTPSPWHRWLGTTCPVY